MNYPMTAALVADNALSKAPFTLVDIGCSGGIGRRWRTFGNQLLAWGIDPVLYEVERLRAAETNPSVHYWAGYIGLPADHPLVLARAGKGYWGHNPWARLSTAEAVAILAEQHTDDATRMHHLEWERTTLAPASERMTLDEFAAARDIIPDFIKLDVDGEDLLTLLSGEELIAGGAVLGLQLEVNYFGSEDPGDHTFHNVDRLLRRHGYGLFDLTVRRYSRAALPAPFAQKVPAATTWGAPLQGDALYLLDPLATAEGRAAAGQWPAARLLKLAALFELWALPDCAAEILLAFRERLAAHVAVDRLLDLLTPPLDGQRCSYEAYVAAFRADPMRFCAK